MNIDSTSTCRNNLIQYMQRCVEFNKKKLNYKITHKQAIPKSIIICLNSYGIFWDFNSNVSKRNTR